MRAAAAEFITSAKGKKKAVILPIAEYERLLEDLHDLSILAERRDETPVFWAEMRLRMQENAKL